MSIVLSVKGVSETSSENRWIHMEFVSEGQTVNSQFYCGVLKRLRDRIRRVRREILDKWILHHDNAPSHTAFIVADLLVKMGVTTLPQPPYSPDVAPPDFFFVPENQEGPKRTAPRDSREGERSCDDLFAGDAR